jgi:hypothetical protein
MLHIFYIGIVETTKFISENIVIITHIFSLKCLKQQSLFHKLAYNLGIFYIEMFQTTKFISHMSWWAKACKANQILL